MHNLPSAAFIPPQVHQLGSGDVGLVDLVQLVGNAKHRFALKSLEKKEMLERNKVGCSFPLPVVIVGFLCASRAWLGICRWSATMYVFLWVPVMKGAGGGRGARRRVQGRAAAGKGPALLGRCSVMGQTVPRLQLPSPQPAPLSPSFTSSPHDTPIPQLEPPTTFGKTHPPTHSRTYHHHRFQPAKSTRPPRSFRRWGACAPRSGS